MWLGTRNGLTLFDGVRTLNFLHSDQNENSIAGNFITCILEDSSNQVWIGNDMGFDLYNARNNSFCHFGIDMSNGQKENVFVIPLAFVSAHDIWFIDTKSKTIKSFNTKTKSLSSGQTAI